MQESDFDTNEPFKAVPYRLGMSFYKAGIGAFFGAGGLAWLKKKYRSGIDERMGIFGPEVPKNALWVHSVSVGEVQSALSLIEASKRHSNLPCVLSTVTPTGRSMAEKLTSRSVDAMVYSPWDVSRFVQRALDTLTPKAYVAMETERWPAMLAELHARGIPTFLANGRLSDESAGRLYKTRGFWRGVLCCFDRLMVRFDSDREKFLSLGVPEEKIVVTGDCKVDALLARKSDVDVLKWRELRNGGGPLFLAGSTHAGEDEIVLQAFKAVRKRFPKARLVIVPRHPERALYVVAQALPYGKVDLFSNLSRDWDVAVVDKIGILFDLYAAADAAFVGGSLVPKGGQNLMEPALFGIQVTHGPYMDDFPDAGRMDAMKASSVVRDVPQLADAWLNALDASCGAAARQACAAYFKTVGGASKQTWEIIEEYLSQGGK